MKTNERIARAAAKLDGIEWDDNFTMGAENYMKAVQAAGFVIVPREPTEAMLVDYESRVYEDKATVWDEMLTAWELENGRVTMTGVDFSTQGDITISRKRK